MKIIDELGNTELHIAAFKNDVEKINELIGKGADTEVKNLMNLTPLIFSVMGNSIEAFECLIEFNVHAKYNYNEVENMIDAFNSYKIANYYGNAKYIDLKHLCKTDNIEKLIEYAEFAIENGLNHSINKDILEILIKINKNDLVQSFMEVLFKVVVYDINKLLDVAIEHNEDLIDYFLNQKNIVINEINVFTAIQYGNKELFINLNNKYLSTKRKVLDSYIVNILKCGIICNKIYVLKEIDKRISFPINCLGMHIDNVALAFDVYLNNSTYMFFILELSIKYDRIEMLKFLFKKEKPVFVKTKDTNLKRFFHLAINSQSTKILQYFINNGMDANSTYLRKRPISLAIKTENAKVIEILAKAGTELYIKGFHKHKPIEYILSKNNNSKEIDEILKVLLTYMKDEEISDCLKKYKNIDSNIFLKLCDILVTLKKEANFIHHFI